MTIRSRSLVHPAGLAPPPQETHRIYRQKLEELIALQTSCSGSIGKQKARLKNLKHTLQR